jgi:hypothetical protein
VFTGDVLYILLKLCWHISIASIVVDNTFAFTFIINTSTMLLKVKKLKFSLRLIN